MGPTPTELPGSAGPTACACHPQVATTFGCSRCGRAFCGNCLASLQGQWLCGYCKGAVVYELSRGRIDMDKRATEALTYSLVGLACLGPILEPIAMVRAIAALRAHRKDAGWPDRWKAITAFTIALPYCLLVLGYIILLVGIAVTAGVAGSK